MSVTLRAASPADEPFFERLLKAALADELMAWMWPEPMRDQLLSMQYRGRRYQVPDSAEIRIVLVDGQEAGWLVVNRSEDRMVLSDIALLADHRGKGVGSEVLGGLVKEADERQLPLYLHVLATNRASRLYERFGFARCGGDEVNLEMKRPPAGRSIQV